MTGQHCAMTMRACVAQALADAGIAIEKEHIAQDHNVDQLRCGILIGSAMGGMATFAQGVEDLTLRVRPLASAAGAVMCHPGLHVPVLCFA